MPQLRVQVIQMYPYTPLWKRGARGDFLRIILKSPFIPPLPSGSASGSESLTARRETALGRRPKGDKNTCN